MMTRVARPFAHDQTKGAAATVRKVAETYLR